MWPFVFTIYNFKCALLPTLNACFTCHLRCWLKNKKSVCTPSVLVMSQFTMELSDIFHPYFH